MKRLSRQQQAQHEVLVTQLTKARDELNAAIAQFNEGVSRLHGELLVPKVEATNAALVAVNTFVEEIHGDQESYYEDRNDNWREGDAGQAYDSWMNEWGDVSFDPLELEDPVPFDEVAMDVDGFARLEAEVNS